MAKPILVVRIPTEINRSEMIYAIEALKDRLTDYHLIPVREVRSEVSFECLNDCKGLQDADIEQLINEFKTQQYGESSKDIC